LSQGAKQEADPQSSTLARLLGSQVAMVQTSLIVLLALVVEIGSGLGLFISTGHLGEVLDERKRRRAGGKGEAPMQGVIIENAPAVERLPQRMVSEAVVVDKGSIEDFCLDRLHLAEGPGSGLSVDEIFGDYLDWCLRLRRSPETRATFAAAFKRLNDSSMQIPVVAGRYHGIRLGEAGSEAA
jgi:hypothetical protein